MEGKRTASATVRDELPEELLDIIRGLEAEGRAWRLVNAAEALAEGHPEALPVLRRRYGDQRTVVFSSPEGRRIICFGHLVARDIGDRPSPPPGRSG